MAKADRKVGNRALATTGGHGGVGWSVLQQAMGLAAMRPLVEQWAVSMAAPETTCWWIRALPVAMEVWAYVRDHCHTTGDPLPGTPVQLKLGATDVVRLPAGSVPYHDPDGCTADDGPDGCSCKMQRAGLLTLFRFDRKAMAHDKRVCVKGGQG